jgi:hypothetical protein
MGRGIVFVTVAMAYVASVQADKTGVFEKIERLRSRQIERCFASQTHSPTGRLQVPLDTEFSRVWKSKSNKSSK